MRFILTVNPNANGLERSVLGIPAIPGVVEDVRATFLKPDCGFATDPTQDPPEMSQ